MERAGVLIMKKDAELRPFSVNVIANTSWSESESTESSSALLDLFSSTSIVYKNEVNDDNNHGYKKF